LICKPILVTKPRYLAISPTVPFHLMVSFW
jgi:hypothetical protein